MAVGQPAGKFNIWYVELRWWQCVVTLEKKNKCYGFILYTQNTRKHISVLKHVHIIKSSQELPFAIKYEICNRCAIKTLHIVINFMVPKGNNRCPGAAHKTLRLPYKPLNTNMYNSDIILTFRMRWIKNTLEKSVKTPGSPRIPTTYLGNSMKNRFSSQIKIAILYIYKSCLVKVYKSGHTHSFKWTVARQTICMQWFRTILTWRDELIEQFTDIRIMTTS